MDFSNVDHASYYDDAGFKSIAPLAFKKKDGSIWPGILMRMKLNAK